MNIKLDENLPTDLVPELVRLGHEVLTPRGQGLLGARDFDTWEVAQCERCFLITTIHAVPATLA